MKTILYICIALAVVVLAASEGMRHAAVSAFKSLTIGIGRLVVGSDYAEIRVVEGHEFDQVINEPGRVVIVVLQSELSAGSHGKNQDLERSIKELPAQILVAKIMVERNQELLKRLDVSAIPALQIYVRGKLVKGFSGNIDKTEFLNAVNESLQNRENTKGASSITPLKKDWLPPGIEAVPSKSSAPMTPLN
mgnify:CR=1 FL=1